MNLPRLQRLFAMTRKMQQEIDAANSRIRKARGEIRLDEALVAKLEGEMQNLSRDIAEAKRQ